MASWTADEARGGGWASPISPLSPNIQDSLYALGTLRLEIDEIAAEPFFTKFADLFDDLGFHVESEAEDNTTATPDHSTSYDIENFSDMKDIFPGWRHPEAEEIVVLSSKKRAPYGLSTILEDHGESRCSIMPVAALSDFEFEFDAFDRPSASGTTANATVCIRRDNGTKYIIKRKRAARNASWSEQTILEILTNIEATFVSKLCWSFHSGEHIYIVTDSLPENNLTDLIREHGPLGTQHATFYASELVVAISSLHGAGIMHKDIEPRNIQLDAQGHVILVNFGRAEFTREATADAQRAVVVSDFDCASAAYRAPELLLGWNHDAAVDCWSFGMLLYYMIFGMHPFGGRQGAEDDYTWVYDRIIRSAIPTESLRLVHPMARDLILKCLERNPALRWDMERIKSHPYFASIDWKNVSSMQMEVPTFQKVAANPMSSEALSTEIPSSHYRHSSLNLPFVDHEVLRTRQHAQSVHKSSTHTSDSHRDDTSSFSRLFAPLTRVEAPALPNFDPLTRAMDVLQEDEKLSITEVNGHGPEIVSESRSVDVNCDNRASQFWDDLEKEAETSAVSINSLEFGTTTGLPYYKAPKLRKYRSAIQSRSRLFNVSTASFQSKLQRKPRSTGALRQPRPVEIIENLPLGIHQIGSGIGFKYNVPSAAASKVSIASFAPSCHLFQRGFSALNLGLALGGSPSAKAKAKSISPAASRSPLNENAIPSSHLNQVQDIGNGTFIREMCQSPTWILSPPESLPSPLALVNSPASSGSEPLSPATLVDAIEDENYHVNITIPKNLELDLDFPLSTWAPTSTLRLVPQSPSAFKLPCLDSGDTSISTYVDNTR